MAVCPAPPRSTGRNRAGTPPLDDAYCPGLWVAFAEQLFQQTLEIEANGGLLVRDGSRHRTPGGVFFFLARRQMSYKARRCVFPQDTPKRPKPKRQPRPSHQDDQPDLPLFVWEQRAEMLRSLLDVPGIASAVKAKVIGRPEQVEVREGYTLVHQQDENAG